MLLDGIAEYAGRRPDDRTPRRAAMHAAAASTAGAARAAGQPCDPPPYDEFAPDELMPVLRLSKGAAGRQVELAAALRYRLHGTSAALLSGRIDIVRARIIAEATADLSPADAVRVEALVLGLADRQTYTALGIALGKAVLRTDPAAAIRRRKKAEKRARVERWREYDGTGALAGRNLPPDDTLAADQALATQAMELRDAGLDGPLDYLRATALIDRITGRDSRPTPDNPRPDHDPDDQDWDNRDDWPAIDQYILDTQHNQAQHNQAQDATAGPDRDTGDRPGNGGGPGDDGTSDDGTSDDGTSDDGTGGVRGPDSGGGGGTRPPPRPAGPRRPGGGGKKHRGQRGKRIAARINLTLPLTTQLELGDAPGDAGPFGPLDPAAARDLARTAAAHPRTRWCLTITDDHGHAIAHGCARGPHPWAGQAPRDRPRSPTGPSSPGRPLDSTPAPPPIPPIN
jgi:hypothetical protein